jgi:hypothetical protein
MVHICIPSITTESLPITGLAGFSKQPYHDARRSRNYPTTGAHPVAAGGLGGYYRRPIPHTPATFDNTFGESLAALRVIDDEPILLS